MDSSENVPEFQSPSKSLRALFRRKDSMDSVQSIDLMSIGSQDRSRNTHNKSPRKSLIAVLLPNFNRSRSSIGSVQVIQQEESPSYAIEEDDFADSDNPSKDYDLESVESILQEYQDQPKEKFVFQEHFDLSSNLSRQASSIQGRTKSRKLSKAAIEKALNMSDSSLGSAFFDARGSSNEPSGSGSGSGSSGGGKRSSTASSNTIRSKRFTIYSDPQNQRQVTAVRESRVLSTSSNIDVLNRSSIFNLTTISDMQHENEDISHDTAEQPLKYEANETVIADEKILRESAHSLSTTELLDKLTQRKSEIDPSNNKNKTSQINRKAFPAGVYEVMPKVQPKLVNIKPPGKLEPVHYHDSDIASHNSAFSTEIVPQEVKTSSPQRAGPSGPSRRPPPKAPTHDRLSSENNHENMLRVNPRVVSGIPMVASASILSNYRTSSDSSQAGNEKRYMTPTVRSFSWTFFLFLMTLGLLLPPIYFLIPVGIFDRLSTNKKNLFFGYDYDIYSPNVVRFSAIQKAISFLWGVFWFAVIIAMIGVGFGVRR